MSSHRQRFVSRTQQRAAALVQWPCAGPAMVRVRGIAACLVVLGALLLCPCAFAYVAPPTEVLSYRRFERIYVYRPQARAQHLALLLSGDGGWSGLLGSIAQRLAASDTLVAGIDVRHFLASLSQDPAPCVAPGAELQSLARFLQQHYQLPSVAPVLMGHSAGATLVYVTLVASTPQVFAGAITLSFCADLDLVKPLCPTRGMVSPLPRSGGVRLQPPVALPAPWIALHGLEDEVCPVADSRTFATAVTDARFVPLPDVDHQYRHLDRWWPQFEAAYRQLLAGGLPQAPEAH